MLLFAVGQRFSHPPHLCKSVNVFVTPNDDIMTDLHKLRKTLRSIRKCGKIVKGNIKIGTLLERKLCYPS